MKQSILLFIDDKPTYQAHHYTFKWREGCQVQQIITRECIGEYISRNTSRKLSRLLNV
jgi:hypothetical protein